MPLSDMFYVGQKVVFKPDRTVVYSLGGRETDISGATGTVLEVKSGYRFSDNRIILTVKIGRRIFNLPDRYIDKETTFGGLKGTVKDFWLTDSE